MVKFIVIEDNLKIQNNIKKLLRRISIQYNQNIEISFFTKFSPELVKEMEQVLYRKVYIMDIELDGTMSGIDIAGKIREFDWESELIFITSHDSMFETVYRNILEVFDFIEKFQNFEQRLEKDIVKIFNKNFDKKMYKVKSKNIDLSIYLNQILYVTKDDRKLTIHTKEANFIVNTSLEKIRESLDTRFVQTHKSCIGNKERIMECNYAQGYFVLDTGEKVEFLSKKYRKEFDAE